MPVAGCEPRMSTLEGFLLTQQVRQRPDGLALEFWLSSPQGPLRYCVDKQEAVFFTPQAHLPEVQAVLAGLGGWRSAALGLRTLAGQPVAGLYFSQQDSYQEARRRLSAAGIPLHEDDLRPPERFLMERFIRGGMRLRGGAVQAGQGLVVHNAAVAPSDYLPNLRLLSLDIETSLDGRELFSIGLFDDREPRVLMRGEGPPSAGLVYCADEPALLRGLVAELQARDPDVLIGWNLIDFDLRLLADKYRHWQIPPALGRGQGMLRLRGSAGDRLYASLPGRVVLDGIECLRSAFFHFDSYALQAVAHELLGRGKLLQGDDRGEAIGELFRRDKPALAAYNLEDCRLVWEIFERTHLIRHRLARTQLTGLPLDKVGGSAAAFDNLYLPRLHRAGYVAPVYASGEGGVGSPGGYVLDSRPGLYDQVLVLDFKSLYPSIIRTFCIDPMGLAEGLAQDPAIAQDAASGAVPGFNGAWFSRQRHILPGLLAELWGARDAAKQAGDGPLAQAIKIIMNACYGVLGSPQCRFFDQRLSSSITLRGHQILTRSQQQIEAWGYPVIYGDTDSLFVWLPGVTEVARADDLGQELAARLNRWWQAELAGQFGLPCYLEIEYETLYTRFLMPRIRGAEQGSKKRYAGLVHRPGGAPQLVFKGLESVRSDWTPLAREFQRELYQRIFAGQPCEAYIRQVVADLEAGRLDRALVYRKRLRRPLAEYRTAVPPHVQAARRLAQHGAPPGPQGVRRGQRIHYLITRAGAEPEGYLTAPIDYQHYLDRQLAPVADGILPFIGTSFEQVLGRQGELF